MVDPPVPFRLTTQLLTMDLEGQNEDLKANPPCHPRACAIQDCLTKHGYKEEKCQSVITALYECCEAFYQSKGDDAVSASCPKPDLLRLKLTRMREESRDASPKK